MSANPNMSQRKQPAFPAGLLRGLDPAVVEALKELIRLHGATVTVQTETGSQIAKRYNTALKRSEVLVGEEWVSESEGLPGAAESSGTGGGSMQGIAPLRSANTQQMVLDIAASLAVVSGALAVVDNGHNHSGSTLSDIAAGDLTAGLAALMPGQPTFTLSSQVGDVIGVGVQLKDCANTNMTETVVFAWVSDAPKGESNINPLLNIGATGKLMGTTGTSGTIPMILTNGSGHFDLDIDCDTFNGTYYLNVSIGGLVFASQAIVFT